VDVPGVLVRTVDVIPKEQRSGDGQFWIRPWLLPTPMCWAHKPFEITRKEK